jgi:hypothetical protein
MPQLNMRSAASTPLPTLPSDFYVFRRKRNSKVAETSQPKKLPVLFHPLIYQLFNPLIQYG